MSRDNRSTSLKTKRNKLLWENFEEIPKKNSFSSDKVRCKLCSNGKHISNTSGNTTGMRTHLKNYHPGVFLSINEGCSNMSENTSPDLDQDETLFIDSSAASTSISRGNTVLGELNTNIIRNDFSCEEESSTQQKKLQKLVAYCVATECLPYSFVEKPGVIQLLRGFNPSYKPISRKSVTETLIPKLKEETESILKKILKEAMFASFTADIWTSDGGDAFIALTCHFVDINWTLQSICLACTVFNDTHTAENIVCFVESTLESWDIPKKKITAFTTDNGANILCAVDSLNIPSISCFAHTLQLGVEKVLKQNEVIVKKCKKLQNLFSGPQCNIRKDLNTLSVKKTGKKAATLPSVCETRWWSTQRLIQAVVKDHNLLMELLNSPRYIDEYSHLILEPEEIIRLKALSCALSSLQEISDELSGETYVTASSILPILRFLEKSSAREFQQDMSQDLFASSPTASEWKNQLIGALGKRYNAKNEDPKRPGNTTPQKKIEIRAEKAKTVLQISTYIDPRFLRMMPEEDLDEAESNILREIIQNNDNGANFKTTSNNRELRGFAKIFSIYGFGQEENAMLTNEDQAMEELRRYKKVIVDLQTDVLKWWQNHSCDFPRLAVIAKKYLCIPATSVPSERVFSRGGRVVTDDRRRLTGKHVEDLIFLSFNKKYVPK